MTKSQRRQAWKRARGRCEYCRLPQACAACNAHKGPNAAGYDPATGALVALFNPRQDKWSKHFSWRGAVLIGKTPVGRATIDVLKINEPQRVVHRDMLLSLGL